MNVLCTCPGKYGDLLWALPTVRAIAETYGTTVDVLVSEAYGSLCPLLQQQPYIVGASACATWRVEDTAPMTPRTPPGYDTQRWDRVFHLGYEGWPQLPLPLEVWRLACQQRQWFPDDPPLRDLELGRPWITVLGVRASDDIPVGFTDEHFELKYGLYMLLARRGWSVEFVGESPRWTQEGHEPGLHWSLAAREIASSKVFLGCCSALHVLAVAVGTPAVVMEPAPARHHDIFWPLGRTGPQVTQVLGGDGQWTFDARHVAETLESVLKAAHV